MAKDQSQSTACQYPLSNLEISEVILENLYVFDDFLYDIWQEWR